jgi:hypothetical protein
MGAYIVKKKDENIQKMIVLGAISYYYSNLFNYYEQDMA